MTNLFFFKCKSDDIGEKKCVIKFSHSQSFVIVLLKKIHTTLFEILGCKKPKGNEPKVYNKLFR